MISAQCLVLCSGIPGDSCNGLFKAHIGIKKGRVTRCYLCRKERKRQIEANRKKINRRLNTNFRTSNKVRRFRLKCIRLEKNVNIVIIIEFEWIYMRIFVSLQMNHIKQEKETVQEDLDMVRMTATAELVRNLPKEQQESIRACIVASQTKGPTGMRYSKAFILEALLLRIKSARAYNHMRDHNIISLPSMITLTRHLNVLKPSYGFLDGVYAALKTKSVEMKPEDKRGNLLS